MKNHKLFFFSGLFLVIVVIAGSGMFIYSRCSQKLATEEVVDFNYRLTGHVNRHYSALLNLLHDKKGVTTIYFKSVTETEEPSKAEISRCRVFTNINQRSLPAFTVNHENDYYHLSGKRNAPCYMYLVLKYDPVTHAWVSYIYKFNPEELPLHWLYVHIKKNIEVGLYNLLL